MTIANASPELPSSATLTTPKRFPLNPRDCKILTALLDKYEVFDSYGYPKKPLARELAESIGVDEDDVYYALKFLRMARFQ